MADREFAKAGTQNDQHANETENDRCPALPTHILLRKITERIVTKDGSRNSSEKASAIGSLVKAITEQIAPIAPQMKRSSHMGRFDVFTMSSQVSSRLFRKGTAAKPNNAR